MPLLELTAIAPQEGCTTESLITVITQLIACTAVQSNTRALYICVIFNCGGDVFGHGL